MPSKGTCCGLCPIEHPGGEALLDSQVLMQTRRTHVRSSPTVKILMNFIVFLFLDHAFHLPHVLLAVLPKS